MAGRHQDRGGGAGDHPACRRATDRSLACRSPVRSAGEPVQLGEPSAIGVPLGHLLDRPLEGRDRLGESPDPLAGQRRRPPVAAVGRRGQLLQVLQLVQLGRGRHHELARGDRAEVLIGHLPSPEVAGPERSLARGEGAPRLLALGPPQLAPGAREQPGPVSYGLLGRRPGQRGPVGGDGLTEDRDG